jgi:hypothetical protein
MILNKEILLNFNERYKIINLLKKKFINLNYLKNH